MKLSVYNVSLGLGIAAAVFLVYKKLRPTPAVGAGTANEDSILTGDINEMAANGDIGAGYTEGMSGGWSF